MNLNVLLDANVLLDLLLTRHEDAKYIGMIIRQIETGRLRGYLTVSIIHILGYWLSKEWGSNKAKKGLLLLLNHFEVLDGNKKAALTALHSSLTDIEDALQYYTCLECGVDAIVSRDKKFIKSAIPSLPVYSPREFINQFSK